MVRQYTATRGQSGTGARRKSQNDSVEKNLCVARPGIIGIGRRNFVLPAGMPGVRSFALALLARLIVSAGETPQQPDYAADARSIERLVNEDYAYLERFDGRRMPMSETLRAAAAAVDSRDALIRYAERALTALADHHAITGSSLADSWALVPSYSDMWVERQGGAYVVTAEREGSPAD